MRGFVNDATWKYFSNLSEQVEFLSDFPGYKTIQKHPTLYSRRNMWSSLKLTCSATWPLDKFALIFFKDKIGFLGKCGDLEHNSRY